ncbi:MAG: hypothetical protein GF390_03090 [Candidatus Pacebacteria bacterium]|nr:hypothetical protein [Candidatus Paceibacterota bacterium]
MLKKLNFSIVLMAVAVFISALMIVATVVFQFDNFFALEEQKTRNTAVDSCLKAATIETFHHSDDREAKTTEPIKSVYNYCLQDKGIEIK